MKSTQLTKLFRSRGSLLILALLVVDIALAFMHGLTHSIDISYRHLDGAYQTASTLFRLADGQWPGRDFFPYLGVGLMYFLYPIFLLAGGDVSASIFTAYFQVACATSFSLGMIAALIFRQQRLLTGVIVASVALILFFTVEPAWLIDRFTPGNSLRPLRSFVPYLAASLVYLLLQSRLRSVALYSAIGGIAGATFLWTNDYGLSTSMLLIALGSVLAYRSGDLRPKVFLWMSGSAIFAGTTLLMLATMGHGIEMEGYNFVDVRVDQFWYFGVWNADSRIFEITDIFSKFLFNKEIIGWWGLVWFLCLAAVYRHPTYESILLPFIGLALFGGGAVASVGGHLEQGYMEPYIFWCQSVALIYAFYLVCRLPSLVMNNVSLASSKAWIFISEHSFLWLGLVVLVVASGDLWYSAQRYQSSVATAQADQARIFVKELGGFLPIAWRNHVELARKNKDAKVIEEYWGIWSGVTHNISGLSVDSVIQALGSKRESFKTKMLELPDHVVTSSQQIGGVFFGWNLSANWWFYKILLQNYEYQQTSPSTYFWSRRSAPEAWPLVGCHIENITDRKSVIIETNHPGYYEVTLNRSGKNTGELNWRSLLLAKNNLNYAFLDGYLSINPHAVEQSYPVRLWNPAQHLDFQLVKAGDSAFDIPFDTCRAHEIVTFFPKLYAAQDSVADLTDDHWLNGISRGGAAVFFVPDTTANTSKFAIGRKVQFVDGSIRHIQRQEATGVYLNVYLDGPPLDGSKVGFPNNIEVSE